MNRRPRQPLAAEPRPPPIVREYTYSAGRLAEAEPPPIRAPRGRSFKGQIHVVVDSDGNATGPTADALRQSFAEFFYASTSRSITSTLQHAVQHLNDKLASENRQSVRKERIYATLACAVIRDDDIYIALAGRAICFVVGPGGLERFGRGDPQPGDRPVDLLGQVEEIGVELFHRPVGDVTALLLSSTGILDLGDETFEQTLKMGHGSIPDVVHRLASRHRGRRRFTSAVISFDEASADPEPPRRIIRDLPRIAPDAVDRSPVRKESSSNPPVRRPPVPERPNPPRRAAPLASDRPVTPAPEKKVSDFRARLFAIPPRRVAAPDGDGVEADRRPVERERRRRSPPTVVERGVDEIENQDSPFVMDVPATSRSELPLPPVGPQRQNRRPSGPIVTFRLPPGSLRIGVIAIALLALFYVGYVVIQIPLRIIREGTGAASAIEKLSQAEQREHEALSQSDPLARRRMLDEASQLASQAAIERPESAAVATASARIRTEFQTATGATHLDAPTKVVDLPSSADQMVFVNPNVFVLDRANSRVYSYLLNVDGTSAQSSANPILLRKGDHVGPETVGDLSQIAWMPPGHGRKSASLIVLDRAGFLVQYEATVGLSLLALRNPEMWADALVLRGFDGNLYSLYSKQRKLMVYFAEQTGYDGTAADYFTSSVPVDLSDPVAFAVDKDLFLVHASGRIESFTNGSPNSFVGPPDDMAPRNPIGLALNADSVFVGDPARSRVIQLTRSGDFQRSLSSDAGPLANFQDLAVAEDGQALFVLSGSAIYRFALPQ